MPMTQTRAVGAVAALLAAGLAGFSLRTAPSSTTTVAARNPAADIRTEVIRRTIHVVRREHPRLGVLPRGSAALPGGGVRTVSAVRTHASGSHASGSAGYSATPGAPVTTRTSASHAGGSYTAGSGAPTAPVTTRTSASHSSGSSATGSAPSGGRVTTRTSSHGTSSTQGGRPTTRSSGGDGSDHGD
jgi:hypothetical protein